MRRHGDRGDNNRSDDKRFTGSDESHRSSTKRPGTGSPSEKNSSSGSSVSSRVQENYKVDFWESVKATFPWTEAGAKVSTGGHKLLAEIQHFDCDGYVSFYVQ